MFDLKKKTILITGATGHLGSCLAYGLADLGATIYVNSRSEKKCNKIVNRILERGGKAFSAPFDVTCEKSIARFSASITELDVVVNNAYAGNGGDFISSRANSYLDSYKNSVVAAAEVTRQLVPHLKKAVEKQNDASVINISSMYAYVSPDQRIYENAEVTNPPFYGAAKAGLNQLTKYIACELAPIKIRVNSISPGPFPTSTTQAEHPGMVRKIISKVPMARLGCPEELVGPVAFLASSASTYVTGINLPVDGGWTSW